MNKHIRTMLSFLLAVTFLISTGLLIRQKFYEKQAEATYQSAAQLAVSQQAPTTEQETISTIEATQPKTEPQVALKTTWFPEAVTNDDNLSALQQIDLTALREKNPDVVGWILIPDTQINYPLLQTDNNTYYLNHAWDGSKNGLGSIFLENLCAKELTDFNTIIYGHNMRSGAMFAALHDFDNPGFREEHPYVYLVSDSGIFRYEIFSTYDADVESRAYGLSFRQEETRTAFLTDAITNSLIETGITPATTDRILTLSTK